MNSSILCLNSGSSSLKFALYRMGDGEETLLVSGAVERIGLDGGILWIRGCDGEKLTEKSGSFSDYASSAQATFEALEEEDLAKYGAVGHRIVHGGPDQTGPRLVDSLFIEKLKALVPFAPLHLPGEIEVMEAVALRYPGLPQVACFDTTFHRTMPEFVQRFPLPRRLWDQGIRRYGFHGLSYEYIMSTFGAEAPPRIVIAHLGNGASMAAVKDGKPVDTTMGFSPIGGFMMGTRSGDLDPGILIHLMDEEEYDVRMIEHMVNHEAGLLGVSEISPDMKALLERRESDQNAALAVTMFCYQLRKQIGAFAAALGGLDTLVFTGGIGERAAPIRLNVCEGLEHLGVLIDPARNEQHEDVVSKGESSCAVRVIPTEEDLIIARHTHSLIS
jgi:acetate kinase